ncbi:MAG: DUF262 domain-containing protein [Candidatus Methanoperedens sp.]
MSLQDEIDKAARDIDQESYTMSIGELISLYQNKELDIHPEFQRVFRWNIQQKSRLIESILIGIPIPSIFVSQREDGVWDVIDGVQRLSTIFEFVGEFRDEDGKLSSPSNLCKTKYLPSLESKSWSDEDNEKSLNLFIWDKVPGNDNKKLLEFLIQKFDIEWIKVAKIEKIEDNKTIRVFSEKNSLSLKLNDEKTKVNLRIDDGRTDDYTVKSKNSELNVYNSITSPQRMYLKRARINVEIVKKQSDLNVKYDLFQRLNSLGTKLSDQELRNCYLIMLNKKLFYWLKELGNYDPFLNCICLTDNAISQQYHLELALRFFIFKNENIEELKKINFALLDDYINKKMEIMAKLELFDEKIEAQIFKSTFTLLNETLGENSFKRYDIEKGKFGGKFLLSAFEAVGIGVGSNINQWIDGNKEENKGILENKVIALWKDKRYNTNIGSGVDFYKRIPNIVPLGKEIFKKEPVE